MPAKFIFRNSSIQQKNCTAKKLLMFIFALVLSTCIYANSNNTNACDTISNIAAGDPLVLYSYNGATSGYQAGNNGYGDLAKAEAFTGSVGAQVTLAVIGFAHAHVVSGHSSNNVTINIWDATGASGSPGNIIGSSTITLGNIATAVNNQSPVFVSFNNPPTLTDANFFIGVVLPTAGDTIALYTNKNNSSDGRGWEQWNDNTWNSYDSAFALSPYHMGNYIKAFYCGNSVGIESINKDMPVNIYPNPANDILNIEWAIIPHAEIYLTDLSGKIVKRFFATENTLNTFDIHELASGPYLVCIVDKQTGQQQTARFMKF